MRLARLPYTILRPSNVYGPRQAAGLEGAVVAAFIEQATRDGALRIYGDGRQTRDFVHVRDVVETLRLATRAATDGGTWNVSTGRSVSVEALADHVERAFGRPMGRSFAAGRPDDAAASMISPAALRRLGWRPTVGLAAGLAELVRDADAEAPRQRDPASG